MKGVVLVDGNEVPVDVIGITTKFYRVRLVCDAKMPGENNFCRKGEVIRVPLALVRVSGNGVQNG